MATKTIAWNTGSGNITLTYTGQGNGSISVSSSENDSFDDRSQSFSIVTTNGSPEQAVSILVKQKGKSYPVGEVFNFAYTGSVQQITLPKGKYKLQCWGAQGGTSYGSSNGAGSKGGYSEGILTLTKTTTLYVFVGGQGSRGSSASLVNGGWNGGGASVGKMSYDSGGINGYSNPACGGGATDISTVTSSMSYSSGVTNRSSASLLARCIVAGGGAGGSYRYTSETTTTESTTTIFSTSVPFNQTLTGDKHNYYKNSVVSGLVEGETVYFSYNKSPNSSTIYFRGSDGKVITSYSNKTSATVPSGAAQISFSLTYNASSGHTSDMSITATVSKKTSTTSTSNSSGYSSKAQQGGGTSGKGPQAGTQTSAGNGGGFGYGASQTVTNHRYGSGAGGGGWYGGGRSYSDTRTDFVDATGGGSGFINTAANASSRPSGYTGLQLDSGTTTAGNSSFPSTSGGTETGHSGNGYARITVIE